MLTNNKHTPEPNQNENKLHYTIIGDSEMENNHLTSMLAGVIIIAAVIGAIVSYFL